MSFGRPPRAVSGSTVLDAVTFDYWNTLCHEPDMDQRRELVADAWIEMLAAAGAEVDREVVATVYDDARTAFNAAWEENRQFTGDHAARYVIERLADGEVGATKLAGLSDRLLDAFHVCSETAEVLPVDGVADVLDELRSRGIRVGIICDVGLMSSPYLRSHLDRHGLLGHFDHWSFSDEVGVYKPDRRIFEHALTGLGRADPRRSAHVGDRRRTDIAGASAMGMRAVRITAVYDDDDPEQGPSGDAVIASYDALFDALDLG